MTHLETERDPRRLQGVHGLRVRLRGGLFLIVHPHVAGSHGRGMTFHVDPKEDVREDPRLEGADERGEIQREEGVHEQDETRERDASDRPVEGRVPGGQRMTSRRPPLYLWGGWRESHPTVAGR